MLCNISVFMVIKIKLQIEKMTSCGPRHLKSLDWTYGIETDVAMSDIIH